MRRPTNGVRCNQATERRWLLVGVPITSYSAGTQADSGQEVVVKAEDKVEEDPKDVPDAGATVSSPPDQETGVVGGFAPVPLSIEKVFLQDYREQLPQYCLEHATQQEMGFLTLLGYNTTVRRGQYAKYYYCLEDVARAEWAAGRGSVQEETPASPP